MNDSSSAPIILAGQTRADDEPRRPIGFTFLEVTGFTMLSTPAPGVAAFRGIYAVSDIHTDYKQNLDWATSLSGYEDDVLLVAGDVSDDLVTFEATMEALSSSFGAVFFVPGNHDLWCRRDSGKNSCDKLRQLTSICNKHQVLTTPQRLDMQSGHAVSILPLLSWYHSSFDTEPDITQLRLPGARAVVADYRATIWPSPLTNGCERLALFFDEMCDELPGLRAEAEAAGRPGITPLASYADARAGDSAVLSFSHFVPRIELIPEKRYLTYPPLMQAVGSNFLGRRLESLQPDIHVFGHTHFGWDAALDPSAACDDADEPGRLRGEGVEGGKGREATSAGGSIRYVQAALATPAERKRRPRSLMVSYDLDLDPTHAQPPLDAHGDSLPLRIFDSSENGGAGGFCPPRRAAWSDHYRSTPREPLEVAPAPWVVDYYARKAPQRLSLTASVERDRADREERRRLLARGDADRSKASASSAPASSVSSSVTSSEAARDAKPLPDVLSSPSDAKTPKPPERVGMWDVSRSATDITKRD